MLILKEYIPVGGMPMAVSAFIENGKNLEKADIEKRDILTLYREDIMKIKTQYRSKVLRIYDQIPSLLSRHEKRVVFNEIAVSSSASSYEETFFWLADSMICNDPNVGLSLNESRAYIKCYMADTGLLVSHAFDENKLLEESVYKLILSDKFSLNEGMLYENLIAQMLTANGHKLYFYTHYSEEKHRNDIKVDFIISSGGKLKYKIHPIEVKTSKKYTTISLERFREKFKDRIGTSYIIHPENLSLKDGIVAIPPYMAWLL